jgi:hypothetical protein
VNSEVKSSGRKIRRIQKSSIRKTRIKRLAFDFLIVTAIFVFHKIGDEKKLRHEYQIINFKQQRSKIA